MNQDKQPLKYTLNYGDYYYTKEDFIPYLNKGQRIYVLYNWNADIYDKGLPGYSTKLAIKNRETFVLCEYYAEGFSMARHCLTACAIKTSSKCY